MRGQQKPTTAPRVSFGIELEFVVAYVFDGEADPDEDIKDGIQPLLVIPRVAEDTSTLSSDSKGKGKANQGFRPVVPPTPWIFEQIRKALAEAGLPVFGGTEYMPLGSVQQKHSEKAMSSFRLTEEYTVSEFDIDGYRFQGVELVSPAMYDMPLSFDLIRLAVSTITTKFRCRVNPTCGFHVHVGAGPTERIEARALRNFAALLWAADPLISRLHAPWRSVTKYSQSGRVNEATALGRNEGPSDSLLDNLGEGGVPVGTTNSLPRIHWIKRSHLKQVKYFGRDRQLGDSVNPDTDQRAQQREVDFDTVDDVAVLKGDPWTRRTPLPPLGSKRSSASLPTDDFGSPKLDYDPPVPRPQTWDRPHSKDHLTAVAPPRPRPPPIERLYPRIPGTMREDRRLDPEFLAPHLYRHDRGGDLDNPGARLPPKRSDVMSGVRDLLAADMTSAQIGEMMRSTTAVKHINYNFSGYTLTSLGNLRAYADGVRVTPGDRYDAKSNTVEFREAAGTLDMQWIATWAKICCRLLEWSRDAPPAEFMAVVRLLAYAQEEKGAQYDVIDFLIDLGLYTEARFCEERVHKGEEVFYECLNFEPTNGTSSGDLQGAFADREDVEMGGMEESSDVGKKDVDGKGGDGEVNSGSAEEAGDDVDDGKSAATDSGAGVGEKNL
ncbi:hypothetical protein CkaCkLH20_05965 [Colletotrichum karsti]|uniref:Amidoligase enzyme n=1 Tax=Colletotrichum karsti TaxID=1095194 RepID=A0A9P6LLG5_9PEZI|nr:uncharacterized protein CkaCkLH20_05965 [Colletotrichum karsti]KAF9876557.1 hypothetical protein CkaCkLH20_05965 [Colletotrichum karsti]